MPSSNRMLAPNLAQTFDAVRAAFSPHLLTGEVADRLRELAAPLRLTSAVGFECRLAADAPQLDLQLGIPVAEAASELVPICESMLTFLPDNSRGWRVWKRIYDFSLEWANHSSEFHKQIFHVWLEFDLPDAPGGELIPSVFATLAAGATPQQPILEDLLQFLTGAPLTPSLRNTLARCRNACPGPSSIGHIGIMLGRAVQACRIDITDVPPDSFAPYLEEIRWPGQAAAVQALAAELRQFVDSVVLCIHVADEVYPGIALEAFFETPDDLNTPWAPLLAHLVERGLCDEAKRDGLLAWTGMTTPPTCSAPWPESLIVSSMLMPPDRFSVFRRRLNHVKISLSPACTLQAKAYFGYAHEWRQWQAP